MPHLPAMVWTLSGLLLLAPALCGTARASGDLPPVVAASDSLVRLFDSGQSFPVFLAGVKSRRATWLGNYAAARVAPGSLERARAVPGRWRLLVVAEDWCGDSANTIPYIARLVDSLVSVELRIVNPRQGRWVMEQHRTPDGRAATPTVVLLDAVGNDVGCFVERPAALRDYLSANRARRSEQARHEGRDAWRRKDAGRSTVGEIVELLESAANGTPVCGETQQ